MTRKKEHHSPEREPEFRTLVIGDLNRWRAEGRDVANFNGVTFLSLQDLDETNLDPAVPSVVLSALVADSFDAVDVALRLSQLGYQGPYRALTGPTTDAEAIVTEISLITPDLDFDIIEVK